MKKLMMTCLSIGLSLLSIQAQNSISKIENENKIPLRQMDQPDCILQVDHNRSNLKYNWVDVASIFKDQLGASTTYYGADMWPDSLPVWQTNDGDIHVWYHGWGDVIDLNSETITKQYKNDDGINPGENRSYFWKGLNLTYNYQRAASCPDNIIDTLRVYLFDDNNLDVLEGNGGTAYVSPLVSQENLRNLQPDDYLKAFEILLTKDSASADASTINAMTLLFDSLEIAKDGRMGFVAHYFPGQTYKMDDILIKADGSIDSLNIFSLIMYEETANQAPVSQNAHPSNLTQGVMATGAARYNSMTGQNADLFNEHYDSRFLYENAGAYEHAYAQYLLSAVGNNFSHNNNSTVISFDGDDNFGATKFAWTFGDNKTSEEEDPTHTYEKAGAYEVCLTSSKGSKSFKTCKTVNVYSSIKEENSIVNTSFFPNPVHESLYIDIETTKENIELTMYNINGERVLQLNSNHNRLKYQFNVEHLTPGLYLLNVKNGRSNYDKKIVIE